jgi:hypothetical protein
MLYENINPTNVVYEGSDLIGRNATGGVLDGEESKGGTHGGIDHAQLQQLFIISQVIHDLRTDGETGDYNLYVLETNSDALTNSKPLLDDVKTYSGINGLRQQAVLTALAQDFTLILGTTDTDLQGRVDPLSGTHQNIATALATEMGSLQGATTPAQIGAEKDTVFNMRDHIMAGRIMANAAPLIAVMGARHVPGVNNLVTGPKFDFNMLQDFLASFGDSGAARLDVASTMSKATDIPEPKKPEPKKSEITFDDDDEFGSFVSGKTPVTKVDEDGFQEFVSGKTPVTKVDEDGFQEFVGGKTPVTKVDEDGFQEFVGGNGESGFDDEDWSEFVSASGGPVTNVNQI